MRVFAQTEPQKTKAITTFTYVIKDITANSNIENLKKYLLKQKQTPLINATRITNARGPLPLVRLFTDDHNLVNDSEHQTNFTDITEH